VVHKVVEGRQDVHADDVRNDVRRIDLGEERRDDSVEAGLCLNNEIISWRLPNVRCQAGPLPEVLGCYEHR
jgi:hypothetical protein